MTNQILPPLILPTNGGSGGQLPSDVVPMGGDIIGTSQNSTVVALQGNPVQPATLGSAQDGQVLTWVNADGQLEMKPVPGVTSLPMTGDVTGTTNSNTIGALQGLSLSTSGAADGDVLTYSALGDSLSLQPAGSGGGTLSGDVTGPNTSNTVSNLHGLALDISDRENGQSLVYSNGSISFDNISLNGDVTGSDNSNSIYSLQGLPLITTSPADGDVLTYSALGGTLSLQPQSGGGILGGDVTGPSGTNTISNLQTVPLHIDSVQDGDMISYSEGSFRNNSPSATIHTFGDVTGTLGDTTVSNLQGTPLLVNNYTNGAVLTFTDVGGSKISLQPVAHVPMAGDVQGYTDDTQIGALQGKDLYLTNTTDGNVLTWSATNNRLELDAPTAYSPEFYQATSSAPMSNPVTGDYVDFGTEIEAVTSYYINTAGNNQYTLFFGSDSTPPLNVSYRLKSNIGSLYDGSFTYQWWDVTNNRGIGNVSGSVGGGVAGEVFAYLPYDYASSPITVGVQLTFVSGTTFIGENTAGGFILPWVTIETLGAPR